MPYYIIFRCCLQLKFIPEVINPACKLSWMEEHWSEEDVKNAKEWTIKMVKLPLIYSKIPLLTSEMLLQMLDHRTAHCHTTTPSQRTHLAGDLNQQPTSATMSSNASHAIHQGMKKLCALRQAAAAHRTVSPSSNGWGLRSSTPAPSAKPVESEEEKEWHEQVNDLMIVKDEFERYIRLGVLEEAEADNLDLDLHWEVSIQLTIHFKLLKMLIQSNQHQFPYLCMTALDILPAQASSVSSERVFLSSKETCTLCRNKITPIFLEVLQILKYIYHQERLDFSSHLSNTTEAELSWMPSAGIGDVRRALGRGGIDELMTVLSSAVPTVTTESSDF